MTQSPRIMFIEDDTDIINVFIHIFKQPGYHAQPISSYAEAYSACLAQPPDVLIMPRLLTQQGEGLELCRKLRATDTLPRFPIILGRADISPLSQEEAYQEAYNAGANACVGYVHTPDDLLELIATLIADPTSSGLMDRQSQHHRTRRRKPIGPNDPQ